MRVCCTASEIKHLHFVSGPPASAASRVYVAQLFYMAASVAVVSIIWERFKIVKVSFEPFPQ